MIPKVETMPIESLLLLDQEQSLWQSSAPWFAMSVVSESSADTGPEYLNHDSGRAIKDDRKSVTEICQIAVFTNILFTLTLNPLLGD